MTIRAQFRIGNIAVDGTNPLQLNITLADGTANNYSKYSAFQNETAGTTPANADVDVLRKTGANVNNVTTNSPLRTVKIVCKDEKEKTKFLNLLNLKNKIKGAAIGTDGAGAGTVGAGAD